VAKQGGISKAIEQLDRYQQEIPQLFHTNQICIALNLFGARYGTIFSDERVLSSVERKWGIKKLPKHG